MKESLRTLSLLVLLLSTIDTLHGQNPVEDLVKSVGLIYFFDHHSNLIRSGTGTIIAKPFNQRQAGIFLITNRHVLPQKHQNDSIIFAIRNSTDSVRQFIEIAIPIYNKTGQISEMIRFDPDGNDLAVINISPIFNAKKEIEYLVDGIFTDSFLATPDSLKENEVSIGDEVLFVGYPSLFFHKKNISPVLRSGVISTLPAESYYF